MSKFVFEGSGYYKMRNGEKYWVIGFKENNILIGEAKGNKMSWYTEGNFIDEKDPHPYDLIEKYKEPRTWFVATWLYPDGTTGCLSSQFKSCLLDDLKHIVNIDGVILTIKQITEGDGINE